MKYSIDNWPFKGFGYWKEHGKSFENYPSAYDFINPEINRTYDKEKLLTYLGNAAVLVVTSRIAVPRIFSSEKTSGSLCVRTDGEWWWVESICEMIEYHDLVIPCTFYEEIKNNDFKYPEFSVEELMILADKLDRPSFDDVV